METITRKPYETDLTDDEWAILEPILKRALYRNKTKTRGDYSAVNLFAGELPFGE